MFCRRTSGSCPPTLFGMLMRLLLLAWVLVGVFAVVAYAAG